MIYTLDKQRWYDIEDALDYDDLDYQLHYSDDQDSIGLEFSTSEQLQYFILKYTKPN
jgi:hypothetical protein